MTRTGIGQLLVGLAALSSILIPVGVDGVLLSRLHMRNPRWLPHAKLHCAMSFHAALALGHLRCCGPCRHPTPARWRWRPSSQRRSGPG